MTRDLQLGNIQSEKKWLPFYFELFPLLAICSPFKERKNCQTSQSRYAISTWCGRFSGLPTFGYLFPRNKITFLGMLMGRVCVANFRALSIVFSLAGMWDTDRHTDIQANIDTRQPPMCVARVDLKNPWHKIARKNKNFWRYKGLQKSFQICPCF